MSVKFKDVKYQLVDHLVVPTLVKPKRSIETEFIELSKNGVLALRKGYACDGPSGPTIDTLDSIRGAFVHDGLYELIGYKLLDIGLRYYADLTFYEIIREDGMNDYRAWAWFNAVRVAGGAFATKTAEVRYAPSKCD